MQREDTEPPPARQPVRSEGMRNRKYQNCTYRNESTGYAPRWAVRTARREHICDCNTEIAAAMMTQILGLLTDEQIEAARDYALRTVKTIPYKEDAA